MPTNRHNNYIAERAVDDMPPDSGLGSLAKAQLLVFDKFDAATAMGCFQFFLNPNSIKVTAAAELTQEAATQSLSAMKFSQTLPRQLCLGEMWFDTYDTRKSVRREYIDHLEKLVRYNPDTHVLPYVAFVWGNFTHDTIFSAEYVFHVKQLTIDYTMFLVDATPVRAKVSMDLTEATTTSWEDLVRPKQSPDHAKFYTVKRGDTLQGIAQHAYRNPREWRRIAVSNGIDDPMSIATGQRLLLPPILK